MKAIRLNLLRTRSRFYVHLLFLLGLFTFPLFTSCRDDCRKPSTAGETETGKYRDAPPESRKKVKDDRKNDKPGDKTTVRQDSTNQKKPYVPVEPVVDYGVPVYHLESPLKPE